MGMEPGSSSANDTSGRLPMKWSYGRALIFTGHMIDRPGRKQARFPARAEARVRAAIRGAVEEIAVAAGKAGIGAEGTLGIAGAASGGDLLFHEVCAELGVATRVLLAMPPDKFVEASVAPAGEAWVRRFRQLLERLGRGNVLVMGERDGLLEGETENVWHRANLWMIEQAVALAPERVLLALWDGKTGDGPGGTEHFVHVAARFGVEVAKPIQIGDLLRNAGDSTGLARSVGVEEQAGDVVDAASSLGDIDER
jgi:hypothetical protein